MPSGLRGRRPNRGRTSHRGRSWAPPWQPAPAGWSSSSSKPKAAISKRCTSGCGEPVSPPAKPSCEARVAKASWLRRRGRYGTCDARRPLLPAAAARARRGQGGTVDSFRRLRHPRRRDLECHGGYRLAARRRHGRAFRAQLDRRSACRGVAPPAHAALPRLPPHGDEPRRPARVLSPRVAPTACRCMSRWARRHSSVQRCAGFGLGVGLVVNPETPIEAAWPFLELIDLLLVMSVHPGFGGQSFMPETVPKVTAAARARSTELGLPVTIQVDGGIDAHDGARDGRSRRPMLRGRIGRLRSGRPSRCRAGDTWVGRRHAGRSLAGDGR